ncbi:MAG: glycosyltransferase, partial [Chitinophagia bacterium]|nr:glycosyltransferase [Chitinophagia bacterium]
IPTYNRPQGLGQCLQSLASQTVDPSLWDVVVVNDGGVDVRGTLDMFSGRIQAQLLNQPNQGPATARNLGARASQAKWIAFLDDDCVAEPDWVENILKHARKGELFGGQVNNRLTDNIYSETCQTLIDYLYQRLDRTTDMFFTSNNMCMLAADFDRIGGFETGFRTSAGEDREFCVRAAHQGIRLRWVPEIRIGHMHRLDLPSFLRLHFKYGRAALSYRKSVNRMEIPERTNGGSGFYLGLLLYPFRKRLPRPFSQSLLLAASQACTIYGFLYELLTARR